MMDEKMEKKFAEELLRVQCDGEDKGYTYVGQIYFDYSDFWFKIDTYTADGRVHPHCFSCKTLQDLKEAARWILEDTAFTEVTTYVKGGSYISFRSLDDIDREFDYYYGE